MTSGDITVSIVLPVFNGAEFLRESIESILNQTHRQFELIIWNDGSQDNSAAIVAEYRDSRVKSFENDRNKGLFRTLNLAISKANSALIKLWSQDDMMKPTSLAEYVAFMKRYPSLGMAYSAYDEIGPTGLVLTPAPVDLTPEVITPNLAAQIMFYHGSIAGNIANVIIRKNALADVGLFREDLIVSGDFEMWVRLSEQYAIGFIRKPLIFLRIHSGQFSRRKGIYSQFMKEDFEIVQALQRRLPKELRGFARKYDRRHRQVQYVHHLVVSLLLSDWVEAAGTYRETVRFGGLIRLLFIWLVTLNQRLFRLKPRYVEV